MRRFLLLTLFLGEVLAAQPASFVNPLPVPSGQYSGISWIGGHRYAVVHDKAPGGGIWYFSLPFLADGTLGKVAAAPAAGTLSSTVQRDPEGIAYVPSTGTFFVSGEADQQILEYGFDGLPTGRSLAVPPAFAPDSIRNNRGFEALSFCAETGLFWTTTESPLPVDESLSDRPLLRLQSFSLSDLQPRDRLRYEMAEPVGDASLADAYVFGVPALAALPDGRLLVLEREVFVPRGGVAVKLKGSFSQTRIFRVDPRQDTGETLEKEEIVSFSTSAWNLADYEGMCLGPAWPGGGRMLLLIADSQEGRGGLLEEWVRVFILPE